MQYFDLTIFEKIVQKPKKNIVFDQILHTGHNYSPGYFGNIVKNYVREYKNINDMHNIPEIIDDSHIHITEAFSVTSLKLLHNLLLFLLTAIPIILKLTAIYSHCC